MHVRGSSPVVKAERIQFGQAALTGSAILNQTAGSLYVGAGGMVVGSASPSFTAQLRLGGGVLGATADSTSTVPVSLTGPAVVTGADSLNVPHAVSFSGNVTGTGSLTKNGSGSVSFFSQGNAFSGTVTVNSGTLGLGGQSGAISVAPTGSLTAIGTLNAPPSSIDGKLAVRYDADALVYPGRIQSSGTLTLGAASVLDITGTGTLTAPIYVLASGTSISGSFASVTGSVPGGYSLVTNFNGGTAIALVSNTASAYDLWASSFNLSGPQAAPDYDADFDGLDNLVEYGLGSNPTQFSAAPALGQSGNFLTLTFNHIAGGGVTFVIEANDDLQGTWDAVQTYPAFGSAGTTTYTDNVAVGTGNTRFLRLSVINN
jgi:autotransporter-associated beta strand protein